MQSFQLTNIARRILLRAASVGQGVEGSVAHLLFPIFGGEAADDVGVLVRGFKVFVTSTNADGDAEDEEDAEDHEPHAAVEEGEPSERGRHRHDLGLLEEECLHGCGEP